MRRKDREVTDIEKINEIIEKADTIRLGLFDGEEVYIVPMSFGHKYDGKHVFYFHSALEGRKIDILNKNPKVAFEIDVDYSLKVGESACAHSAYFSSIVGNGRISFITEVEECKEALAELMYHYTKRRDHKYDPKVFAHVKVFKLDVEKIACKECQK